MLRSRFIVALWCVYFSVVVATYKKCCGEFEGLNMTSSGFECSSAFQEDVLPLRTVGNNTSVLRDEECVDKLVDEVNGAPLLINKNGVKTGAVYLPTIKKCCPDRMRLNTTTWSCSNDEEALTSLLLDEGASLYNLIYESPNCERAFQDHLFENVTSFSISGGALAVWVGEKNYSFANGTYCMDATNGKKTVSIFACHQLKDGLRAVCKSRVCVPKCCHPGFVYRKMKKNYRCAPSWNVTFQLPLTLRNETIDPEDIVLLPGPICSKYMSTKHRLFLNGTIWSGKNWYEPFAGKFCMEHFPDTRGNIKLQYAICSFSAPPEFQNFFYLAGLIVSIIFLGITLTTYFFLPELQNLHGRIVMSHTTSMLAAYTCLAFVKVPVTAYAHNICMILGYGIMYMFLSAFSWLNVMCFDIWWTFGVVQARGLAKKKGIKKFLLYCAYAHGLPLIVTAVALFVDLHENIPLEYKPKIGKNACWFDLSKGPPLEYTIFFITPVGALIGCNVVLFALTARNCLRIRREIQRMQNADSQKKLLFLADKATLLMNLKLFVVMGITWIFELISTYITEPRVLWILLDTVNILQGLWIFCIFVLKENVWRALKKKLGYQEVRDASQTHTTSLSAKISNASIKQNEIVLEERDLLQNNYKPK